MPHASEVGLDDRCYCEVVLNEEAARATGRSFCYEQVPVSVRRPTPLQIPAKPFLQDCEIEDNTARNKGSGGNPFFALLWLRLGAVQRFSRDANLSGRAGFWRRFRPRPYRCE